MKWLCKIHHRWYYSPHNTPLKVGHLTIQRRRCLRCDLIEVQSLIDTTWYKATPTIDELREINLKKLGI